MNYEQQVRYAADLASAYIKKGMFAEYSHAIQAASKNGFAYSFGKEFSEFRKDVAKELRMRGKAKAQRLRDHAVDEAMASPQLKLL